MSDQPAAPKTTGDLAPSWFDAGTHASGPPPGSSTTATTQTPAAASGPVDGALIGRTSIGLIAVVGVILVCAWLLKRLGFQHDRAANRLKIVASRSLGQRERVVIVEVEDEWLVLGVTAHNVNALHRRPAPADANAPAPGNERAPNTQPPSFGRALAANIARLGRR